MRLIKLYSTILLSQFSLFMSLVHYDTRGLNYGRHARTFHCPQSTLQQLHRQNDVRVRNQLILHVSVVVSSYGSRNYAKVSLRLQ